MNILIIDKASISLGFALECQAAGHHVKFFISPKAKDIRTGEGMVPKVREWMPHMKWADLVFMSDNSYALEELDGFFRKGFPIFGCNPRPRAGNSIARRGRTSLSKRGCLRWKAKPFTATKKLKHM